MALPNNLSPLNGTSPNYMSQLQVSFSETFESLTSILQTLWPRPHIVSKDRKFATFQHGAPAQDLNFAVLRKDGAPVSAIGYIPDDHFGRSGAMTSLGVSFWASRPDVPGAGTYLLRKVQAELSQNIYAIGISEDAKRLFRALGFALTSMRHYALTGYNYDSEFWQSSYAGDRRAEGTRTSFETLKSEADLIRVWNSAWSKVYPSRNPKFISRRYLNHPVFSYEVLYLHPPVSSLVVYREVTVQSRVVYRVLEMLTPSSKNSAAVAEFLKVRLDDVGGEFADFYEACAVGISRPGFENLKPSSRLVAPDYLEPLRLENRRIDLAISPKLVGEYYFTRGDTDRDAPSPFAIDDTLMSSQI